MQRDLQAKLDVRMEARNEEREREHMQIEFSYSQARERSEADVLHRMILLHGANCDFSEFDLKGSSSFEQQSCSSIATSSVSSSSRPAPTIMKSSAKKNDSKTRDKKRCQKSWVPIVHQLHLQKGHQKNNKGNVAVEQRRQRHVEF